MMSYRILRDYGPYEGMKMDDAEFATVDEAVKAAVRDGYGVPFLIVQVIDWEAAEEVKRSGEAA